MKRIFVLLVLSFCIALPSFAGDVVRHSVMEVGKESGKAVAVTAKDTAKATAAVAKFLF
jgi:Na+-transporting methylmalonyl-CoA/oxaloacetate decarboxylase gamma subunit